MSGRGRGWYYKQKYGGRGRGGRQGRGENENDQGLGNGSEDAEDSDAPLRSGQPRISGTHQSLLATLKRIDGKGYKAYNDIKGRWNMQDDAFVLCVDHVQSDPYASPSRIRVEVPASLAQFPQRLQKTKVQRIALCDFLGRSFQRAVQRAGADIRAQSGSYGGEKGGEMTVDAGGQHVLERTSVLINSQGDVEARFMVALPARGRSVLGGWAAEILVQNLPRYVESGLYFKQQDAKALEAHIKTVEDTESLRLQLHRLGLVGFVSNGAILPRASGASDKPYGQRDVVPFKSPPSMEVEVKLPNQGVVRGMGVRHGLTLIVGGGFHGKSTLLKALEAGITNKIPGDGRELVVVNPSACKIRAEDGRQVENVDISPFISNLPYGRDTRSFRTEDASGSTSQAANIMEALEMGSRLLLIDEDTTATNFMIRDARMQALIAADKEPITPLVAKMKSLVGLGVSCVLVIGGSGDYFEVADHVIAMEAFKALDLTEKSKAIAKQFGYSYAGSDKTAFGTIAQRRPAVIYPGDSRSVKVKTRAIDTLQFGNEELDLSAVEQLFDASQSRAVGEALLILMDWIAKPQWRGRSLGDLLVALDKEIEAKGLDALSPWRRASNLARPRKFEIAAALNRLRSVKMEQGDSAS